MRRSSPVKRISGSNPPMGAVYEAEDLELGGHVALKTVRPETATDPRAIERFKQEIYLARKVTHPNVCRIFDLFRHRTSSPDGEIMFVTMELLRGETLAQQLRRTGRMSSGEVLPLVSQMVDGLNAAHQVGIVHRDFKPSNVVLVPSMENTEDVRVVVTDFGLAHTTTPDLSVVAVTSTGDIVGTPAYMAPEQLDTGTTTPATDIYALGMVMYEMVTGQLPFTGDTPFAVAVQRLRSSAASPRLLTPDLDTRWEATILRCLERQPADRFASVADVVSALGGKQTGTHPKRGTPEETLDRHGGGCSSTAGSRDSGFRNMAESLRKLPPAVQDPRLDLAEAAAAGSLSDFKGKLTAAARAAEKAVAQGTRILRARAGLLEGEALQDLGEPDKATTAYEEARQIYVATGDRAGVARALNGLAIVRRSQGNLAEARRMYEQVLATYRTIGDRNGVAIVANNTANVLRQQGRLPEAMKLYEESLAVSREIGNKSGAASALNNMAIVFRQQGNLDRAKTMYEEALAIRLEIGEKNGVASTQNNIGNVLSDQGDLPGARKMYEDALATWRAVGEKRGIATGLNNLAFVLWRQGELVAAQKGYEESPDDLSGNR